MAKATVQAALGPVALRRLNEDPNATADDRKYAEILLTICVLSIVVTAPIGAILISLSGTKLLTKTKQLHVVEGKRRMRPARVQRCQDVGLRVHSLKPRFVSHAHAGWRRSHRPSLYDISIIDEVEEREDSENPDRISNADEDAPAASAASAATQQKEDPINGVVGAGGAADEKAKEAASQTRGVPLPVYSSVTK